MRATALVALRDAQESRHLRRLLKQAWPGIEIIAFAGSAKQAREQAIALLPDVCFLQLEDADLCDVDAAAPSSPAVSFVMLAQDRAQAWQSFEWGAVDYLTWPVTLPRLARCVERLQLRIDGLRARAASSVTAAAKLALPFLRVLQGGMVRLVDVHHVDYARSEGKVTVVTWRDDELQCCSGLIHTALRDLAGQLERRQFAQVHRSYVVNLAAVACVQRGPTGRFRVELKGRRETIPVSRSWADVFRVS